MLQAFQEWQTWWAACAILSAFYAVRAISGAGALAAAWLALAILSLGLAAAVPAFPQWLSGTLFVWCLYALCATIHNRRAVVK